MKKIIYSILLVLTPGLFSCKKLLEVEPQSQITEQSYFKNEGDFAPYVTGIYVSVRGLVGTTEALTFGTERSEELIQASTARFTTAWSHVISPNAGAFNYSPYYRAIGNCNLLLARIEPFPFGNVAAKNRIKAEAYSLRALLYFHLVRIVGETPIMLDAIVDDNVPLLPRSPVAEVMNQVFSDLDQAIALFPEKTFITKYVFSFPAAHALKADAKLWSAKVGGGGASAFTDALASVAEVEKANLSLLANPRQITTVRQNAEVILASYFNRDERSPNFGVNALPNLPSVQTATNLDSIPYAVTSANGQGGYQMSLPSRQLFTGLVNDKRLPSTFIIERQGTTTKTAWITKYPGNVYPDSRVSDNDVILYRLADVLLMGAEANAGLNKPLEATGYLNRVRQRAGNGNYAGPTDKVTLEREILNERGRELFFENKRWYDIVRFHHGGTINAYTFVPNLRNKTTPLFWPLTPALLAANPNLKQTAGY